MDAVALHSGEYVERFKSLSTVRVSRLVPLMNIGPDDRVADFGCGIGTLLHYLDQYGNYDGVDFSPDFIAAAKQLKPEGARARFHCEDIIDFCAANPSSFDVATTLDFSEHIDDDTFRLIYSSIHECLKEGGRLYLHTPNLDFFLERAKDIGVIKQFPEHIAVRNGADTVSLLKECGFADCKVETIPHYNILRHLHRLSHLPFVGRLFGARLWIEASR